MERPRLAGPSLFAVVIVITLWFAPRILAQQAKVNVAGSWRNGHYRLGQSGDNVTSDGDFGHATGRFTGPYTFTMSWASATWIGTVSADGNTINWNNNSTWSRDNQGGGTPNCGAVPCVSIIPDATTSCGTYGIAPAMYLFNHANRAATIQVVVSITQNGQTSTSTPTYNQGPDSKAFLGCSGDTNSGQRVRYSVGSVSWN
jgi:hypothetical protein